MSNAPWRVEIARTAQRDLRRLDPPVRRRVERDWRVRFERNAATQTIFVTRILPRGRAYER